MVKTIQRFTFFLFNLDVLSDLRTSQRDKTADSSDSDGDESNNQYSPTPVCITNFLKIIYELLSLLILDNFLSKC